MEPLKLMYNLMAEMLNFIWERVDQIPMDPNRDLWRNLKYSNELSSSIKTGEFLLQPVLQEDFIPALFTHIN
jgi:hypothetical protein